jgi:hypothetical protein
MEETIDFVPVKWRKILASLGYLTSKFVATNNEDFKIFKDMVGFYLRNKKARDTMQMQSNYIKRSFLKRLVIYQNINYWIRNRKLIK